VCVARGACHFVTTVSLVGFYGGPVIDAYEALRDQYRPDRVRVLLIGESPPDPGQGALRFFYSTSLAAADNLYRGVAAAVYGEEPGFDLRDKPAVLARLRADGFWLIDAIEYPINKDSTPIRKRAIRDAAPRLVERVRQLDPVSGVVICHGVVYDAVADALREAGVRVLHDEPLPFPLGNWRQRFVTGLRGALARR
jgi:hypothetical protein